jgi:hypothetical protein
MDSCEICGATEDLGVYDRRGGRDIYICNRGECAQTAQRDERDQYEMEYQDALDELNARFERW